MDTPAGRIDAPAWAPDGDRIAYMRLPAENGRGDVYVSSPDGSDLVQVTNGPGDNVAPVWSPDGEQIAFTRIRGERSDIYVTDPDGDTEKQLTFSTGQNGGPVWQPTD